MLKHKNKIKKFMSLLSRISCKEWFEKIINLSLKKTKKHHEGGGRYAKFGFGIPPLRSFFAASFAVVIQP